MRKSRGVYSCTPRGFFLEQYTLSPLYSSILKVADKVFASLPDWLTS
jgi:hypothetical protein